MIKKVMLFIIIIVMLSPTTSAFNIFKNMENMDKSLSNMDNSLENIGADFKNMNITMNSLLEQLIVFTNAARIDVKDQMIELNGNLLKLETSVSNFSTATKDVHTSIKNIENLKDVVMLFIFVMAVVAICFLIMFVCTIKIISKNGKR